jgi:hypothetical protein
MAGYVIGEMWIGVCVAVVLDIVPPDLTTSAVAVYFFTIQIIGANMPLFVTPITNGLSLRAAMLICFPGFYVVGALFFLVTLLVLRRRDAHAYEFGANMETASVQNGSDKTNYMYKSTENLQDGTDRANYNSTDTLTTAT